MIRVETDVIARWRNTFIKFLAQLEPGSGLSARIRLAKARVDRSHCPLGGSRAMKRSDGRRWSGSGCASRFSIRRRVIGRGGRIELVGGNA
ncbi:hypothetical protein [Burkholderia paludis]|uniref:hypothetical protein n=1 Tax=Burkholderia paludis TaxID=1506587 RepID=UPI003899524D